MLVPTAIVTLQAGGGGTDAVVEPPELEPPELELELLPSKAKQPATVPPVPPVQVQIHEDAPSAVTAEAVPTLHRLLAGAALMVAPLADPHAPSVMVPLEELPDEPLLDESPPDELLDKVEAARLAPQSEAVPPPVP
jgi:hypothetical protein